MTWRILTIGKPALDYAKTGMQTYCQRLQRYTQLEVLHAKERGPEENSLQLLKLSASASRRIVLDERGQDLSTSLLVDQINAWEQDGALKTVAILIGGAAGHSPELRAEAHHLWRLSHLTLQHELALLVFLEALYRAYSIKRGEPYHR